MLLTIAAVPKPFVGHSAIIQRNAISSWSLLPTKPEILLFGGEAGTAEICREMRLRCIGEVARNAHRTPLLSSVFEQAARLATYDILCFVNSDIILLNDFMSALEMVCRWRKRFLMVGRRCDINLSEAIDFASPDWDRRIREAATRTGKMRPVEWIDYFAFPRMLFKSIPPFAIGRPRYDNWLIWRASSLGAAIVDASASVLAVHQNHDYAHIEGGEEGWRKGEETLRNQELMGAPNRFRTIANARYLVTPEGIKPASGEPYAEARKRVRREDLQFRTQPLRHALGLRKRNLERIKRILTKVFK